MNAMIWIALACCWLLASFSLFASATIICMSCATKHAVIHWNKFMNYRIMNSRTGTIMDDHPCENPQNVTCNGLCYIFQVTGISKVDGTRQLFAMAQGCSVGLFDGGVRCFDRPVTLRGRGGSFYLESRYCLCEGDLCTRNSDIWIEYGLKKFYAQKHETVNGLSVSVSEEFVVKQTWHTTNMSKFTTTNSPEMAANNETHFDESKQLNETFSEAQQILGSSHIKNSAQAALISSTSYMILSINVLT